MRTPKEIGESIAAQYVDGSLFPELRDDIANIVAAERAKADALAGALRRIALWFEDEANGDENTLFEYKRVLAALAAYDGETGG